MGSRPNAVPGQVRPGHGRRVRPKTLGSIAFSPLAQRLFGRHIDATHSFDQGLAMAGCLPMIAFIVLATLWPRANDNREDKSC